MKAVSLYQPSAWLVEVGEKRILTREWTTPYRGPVAVHAALQATPAGNAMLQNPIFQEIVRQQYAAGPGAILARGAVIAYAELADVQEIMTRDDVRYLLQTYGARHEITFGNFSIGWHAWILRRVTRLAHPIQSKGGMGLWDWDPPKDAPLFQLGSTPNRIILH